MFANALDIFFFYLSCVALLGAFIAPFAALAVFGIAAWAQHRSSRAT